MTESELNDLAYQLADRYELVNVRYLQRMGEHIKRIGKLSATDVHRIEQYGLMYTNIEQFKQELLACNNLTENDLNNIIDTLLNNEFQGNKALYLLRGKTIQDLTENVILKRNIQSIMNLTANSLTNISNTTVVLEQYQNLVDRSIYAVANGLDDYYSVIRQATKEAGNGARVKYASGITRRLDSAVRMNVLDATRQIYEEIRTQSGEVFGADGVEISAHALCANDHIPVQGLQFSKAEFEKLQSTESCTSYDKQLISPIKRHIATCNCKHTTFPIILGISQPNNSKEQLEQYKNYSEEKIEICGKEYTRYECSQLMRKAETSMRYTKDGYILARAEGDKELQDKYYKKLLNQQAKYREISKLSGLRKQYNRAYVPGFRQ